MAVPLMASAAALLTCPCHTAALALHLSCYQLQVLEGYTYLGSLQQLGADIANAFTNALDEACLLHARSAMTHLDSSTPRMGSLQVLPIPAALAMPHHAGPCWLLPSSARQHTHRAAALHNACSRARSGQMVSGDDWPS